MSRKFKFFHDPKLGRRRLYEVGVEEIPPQEDYQDNSSSVAKYKTISFGPERDMGRMNRGLGVAERHVKETMNVMAGEGRPVEAVGDSKPEPVKKKEIEIDRNMVDHIKNTVK